MIDRREFLRRSGRATLGAAALTALPAWAGDARTPQLDLAGARFAVEWRHVQPRGAGPGDARALGFYSKLVDRLLERGAEPVPTLFRGGLPAALDENGGWSDRATAGRFADYAGIVTRSLGDRVRSWVLLEEPSVFIRNARFALERYLRATHVTNLAVGSGYRAVRAESATARVGSIVRSDLLESATGSAEDAAAVARCRRFETGWFLQPILKGLYPSAFLGEIPYDLMKVANADLETARARLDFIGVRVRERRVVSYDPLHGHGVGLLYAVRTVGPPVSAREMSAVASHVMEDHEVRTYLAQSSSDPWVRPLDAPS